MTADTDFQSRATAEGRQVQDIAKKVLKGSGFKNLKANEVLKHLGVTVNFIGDDASGNRWYFDVSGAFTSSRAGLIRTDTMWKSLGRANVLHQAGHDRLVLLTTNLPKRDSVGHRALTAAAESYFDAIEMLTVEGRARLELYAGSSMSRPLPGLRAPELLYPNLKEATTTSGLELRVPMLDVASALPARVTHDVIRMPCRLKIFIPSKDASGSPISRPTLKSASEKIRGLISQHGGGCTIVPGVGSWVDPIGGEMFEKVALVEAFAKTPFPDDLIAGVVSVVLDELQQHTAALVLDDQMLNVSRL